MEETLSAIQWFKRGFTDIISVMPLHGTPLPGSILTLDSRGKVPAFPVGNNQWVGKSPKSSWTTHDTDDEDCAFWDRNKANIGLRSNYFPGLDIDVKNEQLALMIEDHAREFFQRDGVHIPRRIGLAPKRLLMFRCKEPFRKKTLSFIDPKKEEHLVEFLGQNNQYVIAGNHPKTEAPYYFDVEPDSPNSLIEIDEDMVVAYYEDLIELLELYGCVVAGRQAVIKNAVGPPREGIVSSNLDELEAVLHALPNNNEVAGTRRDYFLVCCMIYNATVVDRDRGKRMWLSWSAKYTDGYNDPEKAEIMFDSLETSTNVLVGAMDIYKLALQYSDYNFGEIMFGGDNALPEQDLAPLDHAGFPEYSQQRMMFDFEYELNRNNIAVFVPQLGVWAFRKGMVWQPDVDTKSNSMMKAEIKNFLLRQALSTSGRLAEEEAEEMRHRLSTYRMNNDCFKLLTETSVSRHRSLLDFDADHNILNTPTAVYHLRTGEKLSIDLNNEEHLCLKQTRCEPDFNMLTPTWKGFLNSITAKINGEIDQSMIDFLQVFLGYSLTGHVTEHKFLFLYGVGGNGKSTLLEVIRDVMGDYAGKVQSEIFLRKRKDNHPTSTTDFLGKRFVYCSEFDEDTTFDSGRIKELTGGDTISSRKMRQDYFNYLPTHTLLIASNWRPKMDTVDEAFRRRVLLCPFELRLAPEDKDIHLRHKLMAEYPGILAWLMEGARKWFEEGLPTCQRISQATVEYFDESDTVQNWIEDNCEVAEELDERDKPEWMTLSQDLFSNWRVWCRNANETEGSRPKFNSRLQSKGFVRTRIGDGYRFKGIRIKAQE